MSSISIGEYRALILGSAPNWSQTVITRIVWKTVIAESLAGYEHRMACYIRPLVETRYKVTNITSRLSSYVRHLLDSRSETPVGVPVWMDGCFLLSDAVEGSTTLNVSAQNRLFPWFRYALLYSDDEDYEVVRITSIQSDTVTLSGGLARDHGKLSLLVPLAFGYLKIPDSQFYTGAISEFEVDFQEKLGWIGSETSQGVTATGGGPQQLDSISQDFDNFTYPPNWGKTPTQGVLDDLEYEALDRGRAEPKSFDSEKRRTFGFVYLADRYQLQSILQFFEYYRGRKGSFYIPSWTEDYVVTQSVQEGDIAIPLERTGLAAMPSSYGGVYQYISDSEMIRLSGTVVRQHCQDIFLPEDDVDEPLEPGTILSAAVKVRLSDDTIEIQSSAPDVHELSLRFVECPHETDAPEGEEDPFQSLISNTTEVWVYQFHRGSQSRIFADWPYSLNISGIPGASHAQAADIRHTGCDFTEDAMASEMEIEASGLVWEYVMEDPESPLDVSIYKGTIDSLGGALLTLFFEGRAMNIHSNQRKVSFTLSSGLRHLQKTGPNIMVQRKCCHLFGSPLCGVVKQSFCVSGLGSLTFQNLTTGSYSISGVQFDVQDDKPDGYWIGAKILIAVAYWRMSGSADCPPYYSGIITRVEHENGSLIFRFTGAADLRYRLPDETLPGYDAVLDRFYLYPICQRTIGSCKMFHNQVHFLGFPWLPNNNPLDALEIDYDARGKK